MGNLIIYYKGERLVYLINTEVEQKVIDWVIEGILKHFPSDVLVEFENNDNYENF